MTILNKMPILFSIKNLDNNITVNVNKKLKNDINNFINMFMSRTKDDNSPYLLCFLDDNIKINIICYKNDIIELSKYERKILEVFLNNDSSTNINRIVKEMEKHSESINLKLDLENIKMITSTLLFIDNNKYYNDYFNNIFQRECNINGNKMIGGFNSDIIKKNFKMTSLLLLLLANPYKYGYNIANLLLSIYNLDVISIILNAAGLSSSIIGKSANFINIIRLLYLITKDEDNEDNNDNTNDENENEDE